jgi:acetyl-CoA C-acetyltransferase
MGSFQGCFTSLAAHQLGAAAIQSALGQSGLNPDDIDEAILGNVLPAGQGQAPARQAILGAGLPQSVNCTTINKVCGSGMKATMLAHDLLKTGTHKAMISGGMESMTNAPYLLAKARGGMRLGHGKVFDHMFLDGLEDAYEKGRLMGTYAETCAGKYEFSRQAQDEFAIRSLRRAIAASNEGKFKNEIAPVAVNTREDELNIVTDEQPFKANIDKIPNLKPAFKADGTVTAANSSSISDGAAALILMRVSQAEKFGLSPLAIILGHTTHAQEPDWFTTAPITAIKKLLNQLDLKTQDIDLYEINEAFAVVTMAAIKDLELPADKVNVHGGACALGHPIGASGARIIVTLLHALKQYSLSRGLASLCIGGGEATAMAIELC